MEKDQQAVDSAQRVSAAVWPWRASEDTAESSETAASTRRKHAVIEAAIGATVGAILFFGFHKVVIPYVVWSIATLVLVGGLFIPPLYVGFKKGGMLLAKGVGVGLSWLLLVPFFYICFAPGRLLMRLSGKDPMCRKFEPDLASYWTDHHGPVDVSQYTKQH